MKKNTYKILSKIPIVGSVVKTKANFFAFKPSPFMAEFTKTKDYEILTSWMKQHPDQILSPKTAAKLLGKSN